jgi:hypothetical protein
MASTTPTTTPVAATVAEAAATLRYWQERVVQAQGALAWARANGRPVAAHESYLGGALAGLAGASERYAATTAAHPA